MEIGHLGLANCRFIFGNIHLEIEFVRMKMANGHFQIENIHFPKAIVT